MEIYEVLKEDHRNLKALLGQLVLCGTVDDSKRKNLIQLIRDEMVPHSRAEEAVFYNFLKQFETTKGLVHHSYAEHLEAEALLRSLQIMEALDANWTKTAYKLKDALEHHIEEEEQRVFPMAEMIISETESQLMAKAFERIKPEVREGSLVRNTLDMVANMLPERLGRPLRSFEVDPSYSSDLYL
jgi:hemerythrin-like domain-containing protein